MIKLVLLILLVDFVKLLEDVRKVESVGCEYFYIDVMDGYFVLNIILGLFVVKSLKKENINMVFDVYFMIENLD